MRTGLAGAALLGGLFVATMLSNSALAGPTYTFTTSMGSQPSNVGTITLTQQTANSVDVKVDLINSNYGFINTGGPHTPFAFDLSGSGTLSISFTSPHVFISGGFFTPGFSFETLSLDTGGGSNMPYGSFTTAIDSSAGNGSGGGYYGDLEFVLTRTGGLSTDDFIANASGAYFTADLSNGSVTGAQAWETKVPEPVTLSLFGAGLAGMAVLRRRKAQKA